MLTHARFKGVMFIKSSVISLFALTSISGCVISQKTQEFSEFEYRGSCGESSTESKWRYASQIPNNASSLANLANENPVFKNGNHLFAVESWFESASGKIMLCRTEQAPKDSCTGSWWIFDKEDSKWFLSKSKGWLCLIH